MFTKKERLEYYKLVLKKLESLKYSDRDENGLYHIKIKNPNYTLWGICQHLRVCSNINMEDLPSYFPELFKYEKPYKIFWWNLGWTGLLTRRIVLRSIIKKLENEIKIIGKTEEKS